jgi:AcrR family transcriptional regulator
MELDIRIKMNEKLYLKNPEQSVIGKKIVIEGLKLINQLGFEHFTFKKLAQEIDTTEASIYRYFENKHRLLVYLITWYWSFLEYKIIINTQHINDPKNQLKAIIKLLVSEPEKENTELEYLSEKEAAHLLKWEGSKAYLTQNISTDNKDQVFKPFKDICKRISTHILEINPKYKFPNSLASTLLEMSHAQKFFMENLPALSESNKSKDKHLIAFLEDLVFKSIEPVK